MSIFTFIFILLIFFSIIWFFKYSDREKIVNDIFDHVESFIKDRDIKKKNRIISELNRMEKDIIKLEKAILNKNIYNEFYKRFKSYKEKILKNL